MFLLTDIREMDEAAFFLALSQRTLYLLYAVASKGKKILLTEVQIIQEKRERARLEKKCPHFFLKKCVGGFEEDLGT